MKPRKVLSVFLAAALLIVVSAITTIATDEAYDYNKKFCVINGNPFMCRADFSIYYGRASASAYFDILNEDEEINYRSIIEELTPGSLSGYYANTYANLMIQEYLGPFSQEYGDSEDRQLTQLPTQPAEAVFYLTSYTPYEYIAMENFYTCGNLAEVLGGGVNYYYNEATQLASRSIETVFYAGIDF